MSVTTDTPPQRRANSRRTRARIVEIATQVLGENSRASMQDIADAAGVNRVTLYRHFAARDDLVIAIQQAAWADWERIAEGIPDTGPAIPALADFFERAVENGERYRIIIGRDTEPEARQAEAAALAPLWRTLERAAAQGEIDARLDPHFGLSLAGSLVAAAVFSIGRGIAREKAIKSARLAWIKAMTHTEDATHHENATHPEDAR